ncbi:MAG: flagellar hook-basal body complex protein FliE [Rhizobiales bacterium]|nr:flagellar hook-basal body complex protein FliE [Hyphomicrobiales bacterium]
MPTPGAAANAYASLARLVSPGQGLAAGSATAPAGQSFSAILKDAIGSVSESGAKSDAQTQAVAAGKANVVDVVTAVAETEVAIDALVAVRDKVVQAYEEIMKMPI